jgi:ubiquinone/menaquinone biosynthesis C-methylase UbiE
MKHKQAHSSKKTSWEPVSNWYDQIVSKDGHYYHQEVIFPFLQEYVFKDLKKETSVLELACGQGVLERKLKKEHQYVGLDLSKGLLKAAEKEKISESHRFIEQDVTAPFSLNQLFDVGFIILALQNFKNPEGAILNLSQHIKVQGRVILVLNHPIFRIPRQSSWGVDEAKKIQFRRVDRYMTPMEIPIAMQPSKGQESSQTFSYHHPLSFFSKLFQEHGFCINRIEELCSNKKSEGGAKKMEDRARSEFPLFMVIELIKLR